MGAPAGCLLLRECSLFPPQTEAHSRVPAQRSSSLAGSQAPLGATCLPAWETGKTGIPRGPYSIQRLHSGPLFVCVLCGLEVYNACTLTHDLCTGLLTSALLQTTTSTIRMPSTLLRCGAACRISG